MYICMYVCIYIHKSVCTCGWMDGWMDVCRHYVCMHAQMDIDRITLMYVYRQNYKNVCMSVCAYIYIYIYTSSSRILILYNVSFSQRIHK